MLSCVAVTGDSAVNCLLWLSATAIPSACIFDGDSTFGGVVSLFCAFWLTSVLCGAGVATLESSGFGAVDNCAGLKYSSTAMAPATNIKALNV